MNIPKKNSFPRALQDLNQWVCWKLALQKNGKSKKIPFNPHTGRPASVTDHNTWGSFPDANKGCKKFKLNGVGFVFTADDPFVGVDLDGCRNPETGQIKIWAEKIIKSLDSYTEVSPSGTGVKIFIIGTIPSSLKTERVEVYAEKRFFTVTGQHIAGTQHEITEPDPVIIELIFEKYKRLKETRLSKGRHGKGHPSKSKIGLTVSTDHSTANFSRLFEGDWSRFPSRSEADLALCHRLARLTKCSATRTDSLFRQSGLYRDKWDRQYSDGSTYGQRTIRRAIALVKSNK
jgi:primase-polymerase (primpol)-like protein